MLTTIDPSKFVVQSDGILGAVEISTFFSLIFYGISLSQGYTYFRQRKDDRFTLKLLVTMILFLETCHSFTAPWAVYYDTITRWGAPEANSYPISANVTIELVVTLLVQCYFISRIYKLSFENLYITVGCLILVSLRFIGGVMLAIEAYLDVPNTPNGIALVVHWDWLITSVLAIGGAADVTIAICMTCILIKLSSPNNEETTNIINRLIRWTLQTGLITSMISVSVIICFQAMKNMVWFGLYIILAKFYSNALLVSLNARPHRKVRKNTHKTLTAIHFEPGRGPISISFPTGLGHNETDWEEKTRSEEV